MKRFFSLFLMLVMSLCELSMSILPRQEKISGIMEEKSLGDF